MTKQEVVTVRGALEKAKAFEEKKEWQQAIDCYKAILRYDKNHVQSLIKLACMAIDTKEWDNAYAFAYRAFRCKYVEFDDYVTIGKVFYTIEKYAMAARVFMKAEILKPDDFFVLESLCKIFLKDESHNMVIKYGLKALKQKESAGLHIDLAKAYGKINKVHEVIEHCDRAIELQPHNKVAYLLKVRSLFNKGEHELANQILQQQELSKDSAMYYSIVNSKRMSEEDRTIIDEMVNYAQDEKLPETEKISICYALGKAYDDLKQYDRAFHYYHKAAEAKKLMVEFDIVAYEYRMAMTKQVFTAALLKQRRQVAIASKLPIFVVSMPRSGSTLTEQILTSHPNIMGAGESPFMNSLSQSLEPIKHPMFGNLLHYPENIEHYGKQDLQALARRYIQSCVEYIKERDGDHKGYMKITDKLPANYERVGLILLLFSNAKIINCYRHPLDVCLSIYFQNFAMIDYSYDLELIARCYKQYDLLMKHWHQQFPGKILDVYYEETVQYQDMVTKQMLDYCELPWDDACLSFHENKRAIHTASNWQVRQPIYQRSKYRWKNYEQHIGLLKDMLIVEIREYEQLLAERMLIREEEKAHG